MRAQPAREAQRIEQPALAGRRRHDRELHAGADAFGRSEIAVRGGDGVAELAGQRVHQHAGARFQPTEVEAGEDVADVQGAVPHKASRMIAAAWPLP